MSMSIVSIFNYSSTYNVHVAFSRSDPRKGTNILLGFNGSFSVSASTTTIGIPSYLQLNDVSGNKVDPSGVVFTGGYTGYTISAPGVYSIVDPPKMGTSRYRKSNIQVFRKALYTPFRG